jgi:hypothetical protein
MVRLLGHKRFILFVFSMIGKSGQPGHDVASIIAFATRVFNARPNGPALRGKGYAFAFNSDAFAYLEIFVVSHLSPSPRPKASHQKPQRA